MTEVATPPRAEPTPSKTTLPSRLALAIGVAGAVVWVASHRELFRAEAIEARVAALGPWAPLGFILIYAVATVLFAPGSALTVVGGAVFGPVLGAIYSLAGATLGATLGFLIARHLAGDWVLRHARGRVRDLVEGVGARGWRFVALVRLVPLLPFNLLNYALALTPIRLVPYVVTSFACMIPGATAVRPACPSHA